MNVETVSTVHTFIGSFICKEIEQTKQGMKTAEQKGGKRIQTRARARFCHLAHRIITAKRLADINKLSRTRDGCSVDTPPPPWH